MIRFALCVILQDNRVCACMCIQKAYRHYIICKAKATAAALHQMQLVAAITVLQSLHRLKSTRTKYLCSLRRQNRAAVHIQRICRGGTVRIRHARQLQDAAAITIQQTIQQQEYQEQQQTQIQEAAAVIVQKAVLRAAQVRRNSKQLHLQHAADVSTGHAKTTSDQADAVRDLSNLIDSSHPSDRTATAALEHHDAMTVVDFTVQCNDASPAMTMQQVCPTQIVGSISDNTDTTYTKLSNEHVPLSEERQSTTNTNELADCTKSGSGMKSSDNSDKSAMSYTEETYMSTDAADLYESATTDNCDIVTTAMQLSTSADAVITVLQCNTCGHHADLKKSSNDAVQQSTANANALYQYCHCGGDYIYTSITVQHQQQQQSDCVNVTGSVKGGAISDNCSISKQLQSEDTTTKVLPLESSLAAPVIAITLTAAEKLRRSQLDLHAHRIQRQFKRYQQQQSQQSQARTVLIRWLVHHIQGQRARAQYLYKLKCIVVVQACIRRHAAIQCIDALRQARLQHWLTLTSHISCPLSELISSGEDEWHSSNSSSSSSDSISSSSSVIANIDDIANKHELHIQRMLLGHDCHTTAPHGCDVVISSLQSLISRDMNLVLKPVYNPDTLVIEVVKHTVDATAS
jgi:hypothetical protein